jgi:glycosyltransferase involved in cell wall biosynthesis
LVNELDGVNFDPVWYLHTYPDVRDAGIDPWLHFSTFGMKENRQPYYIPALDLDRMLWSGCSLYALPRLEKLIVSGSGRDRAAAGWVLARWFKDQGNLQAAREAIGVFVDFVETKATIQHPGPYLLAVEIGLETDDLPFAKFALYAGLERFGPRPDFNLAKFFYHKTASGDPSDIYSDLAQLFRGAGLYSVMFEKNDSCLFDQLLSCGASATDLLGFSDQPLVSVILPVFNGADVLHKALHGLMCQTYTNMEIIVVDDNSTDATGAIVRNWAAFDSRIRVLQHETNQGAYASRNTGFDAARGTFVTVQDADDWAHPQKIEAQARALIGASDLVASVSHWVRVSGDLNIAQWRTEDSWIYRNISSLMIRSELREHLGYWDRVRVNADTEYYYRIAAAYGVSSIKEVYPGIPLSFGRMRPTSLTGQESTHARTQFNGVRKAYMDAALYWHHQAKSVGELFMPRFPRKRPFRVPDDIGPSDQEGNETPYDIIKRSELFNSNWYLHRYRDVMQAGVGPVQHYLMAGASEDRDPGPQFSSGGYRLAQNLGEGENPLLHYETWGRMAGGAPLPRFAGALDGSEGDDPCTLVFAHSAGRMLFGAERSLIDVVTRLAEWGQNPVVVLPEIGNLTYLENLRAVSVAVEVAPQSWRFGGYEPIEDIINRCRALIRAYRTKMVYVNTITLDAPLIAARAEGVPSKIHVRELPDQDPDLCCTLGMDAAQLRSELLMQSDSFLATSSIVADWLGVPERTTVLPNSVDEALFGLTFAPNHVLNVALISSNIIKKGLWDFLAVARRVAQEGGRVRFLLFGPLTSDLEQMMPLPENVEFCGYADNPLDALAKADIVMSLSKFSESFGRTIMEAMAAGRPVICYNRGAPPLLLESGVSGYVVPPDDIETAAIAVLALDAARLQLPRFSDAARSRARVLQEQAMVVWE